MGISIDCIFTILNILLRFWENLHRLLLIWKFQKNFQKAVLSWMVALYPWISQHIVIYYAEAQLLPYQLYRWYGTSSHRRPWLIGSHFNCKTIHGKKSCQTMSYTNLFSYMINTIKHWFSPCRHSNRSVKRFIDFVRLVKVKNCWYKTRLRQATPHKNYLLKSVVNLVDIVGQK